MRLGRYFAVSPRFWLNLQVRHDLDALEDSIGEEIERSVPVLERPDLAAVTLA